jgi:hypothetical protein
LKPQMTIRLPPNFRTWAVSDVACMTAVRRADEKSGNGIYPVFDAFLPPKDPV